MGTGAPARSFLAFLCIACLQAAEAARRDFETLSCGRVARSHEPPLAPSGLRGRAARSRPQGRQLGERKKPHAHPRRVKEAAAWAARRRRRRRRRLGGGAEARRAAPARSSTAGPGRAPPAADAATHLLGEVVLQLREEKQHHDEPADNRHCRGDENRRQPRRSRPPRLTSPHSRLSPPAAAAAAAPSRCRAPARKAPPPAAGRPHPARSPSAPPHVLTRKSSRVLGKASNRFSRHSESMAPRGPEPNPPSGAGPAPPRHRPAGQRGPKPAEGAGGEGPGLGLPGSEGAGRSSLPPRPLLSLPASGPRGGALEDTRETLTGPRSLSWEGLETEAELLPESSFHSVSPPPHPIPIPIPSPASSFDTAGVCYPRPSFGEQPICLSLRLAVAATKLKAERLGRVPALIVPKHGRKKEGEEGKREEKNLPSLACTLHPFLLVPPPPVFPSLLTGKGYELRTLNRTAARNSLLVQARKREYKLFLSHVRA